MSVVVVEGRLARREDAEAGLLYAVYASMHNM